MPIIQLQDPLNALNSAAEGYVAGRARVDAKRQADLQAAYQKQRDEKDDTFKAQQQALEQKKFDFTQHQADATADSDKATSAVAQMGDDYENALSTTVSQAADQIEQHLFASGDPQAIAANVQNVVQEAQKGWYSSRADQKFRAEGKQLGLSDGQIQSEMAKRHEKVLADIRTRIQKAYADYQKQNAQTGLQDYRTGNQALNELKFGQTVSNENANTAIRGAAAANRPVPGSLTQMEQWEIGHGGTPAQVFAQQHPKSAKPPSASQQESAQSDAELDHRIQVGLNSGGNVDDPKLIPYYVKLGFSKKQVTAAVERARSYKPKTPTGGGFGPEPSGGSQASNPFAPPS